MSKDSMRFDFASDSDEQHNMQIPKVLHYCWFGGAPLPAFVQECIASWKKYCPDYKIVEWNESNFDIGMNNFLQKAYENKKWAFVTDYARLHIIYHHGGIYLDTDVELLRGLDDLLGYPAYMGFEGSEYINTGLGFGAVKQFPLLKEMLGLYESLDFDCVKDRVEQISTPIILTKLLERYGLIRNGERQTVEGLELFPEDYFCPKNPITRFLNVTDNTHSIHHYDASWVDEKEKAYIGSLENKAQKIMESQSKKISIIIPVYNGQNYLREAIDSALAQTYKNIEVIVINDGSTDETDQIARSYGNRIRYFKKENGGVSSALNLAIRKMRGVYVAWLSHDDKYHPEKLEKQMMFASQFMDRVVTVTNWSIIDGAGIHVKNNFLDSKLEISAKAFLAFDRKTWLNGCAMLIPKALFDKVGLFDETLKSTQDYDMWMRFAKVVQFKIMPDHLLYSRAHAQQGSLSMPDALKNSDMIHTRIISELSGEEIAEYFDHSTKQYMDVYYNFLHSGYKRTPAQILNSLLNQLSSEGKDREISKIIHSELLGLIGADYLVRRNSTNLISKEKNRKRLLFFTAHWYTGGVERFISNLTNGLMSTYDIIVVSVDSDREGFIKLPDGINHIRVSHENFVNSYDYIIYALCIIYQIDIAIGCMNLFAKVLDFYELSEGAPFKTIASNHEFYFYPHEHDYFYPLVDKRIHSYKNADAVVWLTNYSTFVYSNFNNNGVLIANPNTYDIQNRSTERSEKVILCVGRFNDYVKRIDRILLCFKYVLDDTPNAILVLVGKYDPSVAFMPNSPKSINDLINDMALPKDQIFFEGETSDVTRYYLAASVLLLTSNSEGFPMVINEAACYGVPTISNYIAGFEDIIVDGENGYLVPQDDIEALATKVSKVLNDNALWMRLSDNARYMARRFEQKVIVDKWERLFEILLIEDFYANIESSLKEAFGYAPDVLTLHARNLCAETHKIVRFAYCSKLPKETDPAPWSSFQLTQQPASDVISAPLLFSGDHGRLRLYYNKVKVSYRTYGLKITLSKIFSKIMHKLGPQH